MLFGQTGLLRLIARVWARHQLVRLVQKYEVANSGIKGSHAFMKLPYWRVATRPMDAMHTYAHEVACDSTYIHHIYHISAWQLNVWHGMDIQIYRMYS